MEYFNGILQQDFNKIYTNIENCAIVNPPYLNGRVPHTFYFDKRGGFEVFEALGYDKITDTISNSDGEFYIGEIGANIVVKKGTTTLSTAAKTFDRNFKFIYGTSVKGPSVESGTVLASNITDPLNIYLEDSGKTWTVDAYAGKYVYIYDSTSGTGQVIKINSNTATRLYVGGIQGTITAGVYKIFDELGSIPFFLGGDGLYGIHDDTEIIKVENFSNITDIVFVHDRYFSIDQNGNINKGDKGQFLLYQDALSHVTTVSNVLSLTAFQDYLLILSSDSVSLIKKENITLGGETIEEFTWSLVTRDFGLFSLGAFEIYNEGLYLVDSNRKFVSLSVNAVTDTKFTTTVSDEGIYIQKDLDNIGLGSHLRIYINSNEIKIINTGVANTDIFIYDRYYKGWHKWLSQLPLYGYSNATDKYYGTDLYNVSTLSETDSGALDITQKIKLIIGEENITAFKNIKFQKLILGTHTDEGIVMNYTITSGEDLIRFPKEIKGTKLLKQGSLEKAAEGSALGQTILGLGLLGDNDETLEYLYPKVGAVKVNLGYACEIMEAELVAVSGKKIVYGGQLIGYEQAQPGLTSVKNVI